MPSLRDAIKTRSDYEYLLRVLRRSLGDPEDDGWVPMPGTPVPGSGSFSEQGWWEYSGGGRSRRRIREQPPPPEEEPRVADPPVSPEIPEADEGPVQEDVLEESPAPRRRSRFQVLEL